ETSRPWIETRLRPPRPTASRRGRPSTNRAWIETGAAGRFRRPAPEVGRQQTGRGLKPLRFILGCQPLREVGRQQTGRGLKLLRRGGVGRRRGRSAGNKPAVD